MDENAEQGGGAPMPSQVGQDTDSIVEKIITLSRTIKDLDGAIQDRAQPLIAQLKALEEVMNADLAELKSQSDKLKQELAEDKNLLIEHWPISSGRIERRGWTIDRKERKSVDIVNEENLALEVINAISWDKMPLTINWNKTKLAKLLEVGAIDETLARPVVGVSIAVTSPKALLDEEQAAQEAHDRIEDARAEAEKEV